MEVSEHLSNPTSLNQLDLGHNIISDTIPSKIGNLQKMVAPVSETQQFDWTDSTVHWRYHWPVIT